MPVAWKLSIFSSGRASNGVSLSATPTLLNPPPAAIAPGPAGLTVAVVVVFFGPALGALLAFEGSDFSSSANNRAFSALRAASALRFSSFASLALLVLALSSHAAASFRSWYQTNKGVGEV